MAANLVTYDDFEPSINVVKEKDSETIIFNLPDFKKEQLRVQLTISNILRITGSRPITDNKWRRFTKNIEVPDNCNMQTISAKFEGGKLYIKLPKLIVEEEKQPTPASRGNPSKPITAQDNVTATKEEEPVPNAINTGNVSSDIAEKKPSINANDEEKDKESADKIKSVKEDIKTKIDNYKETGSSVASKLKAPRSVTTVVVAVILVVSLGLYISKVISSCKVDVICT